MKQVVVKIPGKIMLSGEYAVLKGTPCLAVTINRYMLVTTTLKADDTFELISDYWQQPIILKTTQLITTNNPVVKTILATQQQWPLPGATITIASQLDPNFGFGSSSALRLGIIIGCYSLYCRQKLKLSLTAPQTWQLAQCAINLQLQAQSIASGYDIITQLCGGLIEYSPQKPWPQCAKSITYNEQTLQNNIHIFVGGKGAVTKNVVKETMAWLNTTKSLPQLIKITKQLNTELLKLLSTTNTKPSRNLINTLAQHRQLFAPNKCYPQHLAATLAQVHGLDSTWGYKTTGAGGEDAILVFANKNDLSRVTAAIKPLGWYNIEYQSSTKGTVIATKF